MSSRHGGDQSHKSVKNKKPSRKNYEKENEELTSKIKEIDDGLKSLNLKVPDKEFYASQRNEDIFKLNDVKFRRENQFKEKRVVDAELREVNQEIPTKYDAVGKLKSSLKYKKPERVDEVIRKLQGQLQRMQMKASEQKRIHQEISDLEGSKAKIQDFKKLEEEIKMLKEKQKNLRDQRDENVRLITALKQEETAARSTLDTHKITEDEEWAIYKENLSKRDQLRIQKEELIKKRKELNEQYRSKQATRRGNLARRDSQRGMMSWLLSDQDSKNRDVHATQTTKTITERKKPFADKITQCKVLLSYLDKWESQSSHSDTKDSEEIESNEPQELETESKNRDDIYRGVRRKPSKRERRRKHHVTETTKKLEFHFTVLEQFVALGIQPPASALEIPEAKAAIKQKKKYYKEKQAEVMQSMKRSKSSQFIGVSKEYPFIKRQNNVIFGEDNTADFTNKAEKLSDFESALKRRHKSCPSLSRDTNYHPEIDSSHQKEFASDRDSTQSRDFSASNSEFEPDSPRSCTSSTSFGDVKSYFNDDKRRSFVIDEDIDDLDVTLEDGHKHSKVQHKVHFSSEVTEVDDNKLLQKGSLNVAKFDGLIAEKALHEERMVSTTLTNHPQVNGDETISLVDVRVEARKGCSGILIEPEEKPSAVPKEKVQITSEDENVYDSDDESEDSGDGRGFSDSTELQFPIDDLPSGSFDKQPSSMKNSTGTDKNTVLFKPQITDALPNAARSAGGCSPRRGQGYFDKNEESVEVKT